jgi:4-aminobutyrate aminotransferase
VPEISWDDLAAFTEPRLVTEPPGPNARAIVASDRQITSPSLPRAYELVPARGAGAIIEDVDGNVFIDFNAGIAVCSTGHAHPDVTDAITNQASRLLHYSASDFYLPIYVEMCGRLDSIAPISGPTRSFLANSGTEAVEAALKLSRHATGRQYIIGFFGSFHGRSYGSVSVTASSSKYKRGFGPMLPGVVHAPYGDDSRFIEDVLFKRIVPPDEVAAIIFEPVLGEGGYVIPPAEWVRSLRELCDEHGITLVADEVQSGMGRTGRMWAIEHFDVEPDIVLTGKGIASGLPLAAMTARAELMSWGAGAHGSTYGGNPVACAAGLATIDLIEKELMSNAEQIGAVLLEGVIGLAGKDTVTDVRGLGLMIGIEFSTPEIADRVQDICFKRGLLVLRAGDAAVRLSPPLVINRAQAETGIRIFTDAVDAVNG